MLNPMHMELIACIEGLKGALSLGFTKIVLEYDAQQVVWAIQGNDFSPAVVVGGLVHELKVLFIECFETFHVNYAPCECNRVAHELTYIGSRSKVFVASVLAELPACRCFWCQAI